jgi:hypothetical protein
MVSKLILPPPNLVHNVYSLGLIEGGLSKIEKIFEEGLASGYRRRHKLFTHTPFLGKNAAIQFGLSYFELISSYAVVDDFF